MACSLNILKKILNANFYLYIEGDSAYPLVPWLMVPIQNRENLDRHQRLFNIFHSRVRNLVERCIGVLKLRFRCILGEKKLRYHPTKASQIFNACVVLHNLLIFNRFNILHEINENNLQNQIQLERERANELMVLPNARENRDGAIILRNQLIQYLFV